MSCIENNMDNSFNFEKITKQKTAQELMTELENLNVKKDELEQTEEGFDEPNNLFELEKVKQNITQVEKDLQRRVDNN